MTVCWSCWLKLTSLDLVVQSSPWWVGYIEKYPEQQGSFPSNYVKLAGGDGWKDTMMLDLPAGP